MGESEHNTLRKLEANPVQPKIKTAMYKHIEFPAAFLQGFFKASAHNLIILAPLLAPWQSLAKWHRPRIRACTTFSCTSRLHQFNQQWSKIIPTTQEVLHSCHQRINDISHKIPSKAASTYSRFSKVSNLQPGNPCQCQMFPLIPLV